ncbi:hypothetical protein niasHT_031869 [Heterodera trifolii]|uniref:Uncharacterized protein n=1 Tax=Heterodera trifolii TaxID=157864 RepID=A0ABD2I2T4_9BILA
MIEPNSVESVPVNCSVCSGKCKFHSGVKCCEACKHFFRRSISSMKEYYCKSAGECDVKKDSTCKRCRLKKCFTVGMNPRRVCVKNVNNEQILAYIQRIKLLMTSANSAATIAPSSAEIGMELLTETSATNGPLKWHLPNSQLVKKDFLGFIVLNHLLEIEQKVRRIRFSQTTIPEIFYEQCDSFESIFGRKLNLLELADKFSIKLPLHSSEEILEIIRRIGPFGNRPSHMVMDFLFVFEIGKTFTFFEQLNISDKIALCSNIAMPLYVLCNSFYSVQQSFDVLCTPADMPLIYAFTKSYFKYNQTVMEMGDKLLCKAVKPFSRLKLSTEEFVLIRAIIFSHMVSPGLSDQAQKLLFTEAEKFSSLLMSVLQLNYGAAPGALRYMELMGLIDCVFNTGAKHRQFLTYISNILDPNFDRVFPPVLAKICTTGPVESHQLFPY